MFRAQPQAPRCQRGYAERGSPTSSARACLEKARFEPEDELPELHPVATQSSIIHPYPVFEDIMSSPPRLQPTKPARTPATSIGRSRAYALFGADDDKSSSKTAVVSSAPPVLSLSDDDGEGEGDEGGCTGSSSIWQASRSVRGDDCLLELECTGERPFAKLRRLR